MRAPAHTPVGSRTDVRASCARHPQMPTCADTHVDQHLLNPKKCFSSKTEQASSLTAVGHRQGKRSLQRLCFQPRRNMSRCVAPIPAPSHVSRHRKSR